MKNSRTVQFQFANGTQYCESSSTRSIITRAVMDHTPHAFNILARKAAPCSGYSEVHGAAGHVPKCPTNGPAETQWARQTHLQLVPSLRVLLGGQVIVALAHTAVGNLFQQLTP